MTSKEALEVNKSLKIIDDFWTKYEEVNKSLKIIDDFWTKCRKGQHTNTTKFCSECGQRLDYNGMDGLIHE